MKRRIHPDLSRQRLQRALEQWRLRLARPDAVLELSLLGLISGLIAGVVSILFRLTVEWSQELFLIGPPGSYETLEWGARLLLPVGGGLLLGLLLHFYDPERRVVGVVHVMERLQYHQGHFPLSNAIVQFLGGALALISGHSVGREGPGVHLGVVASNLPAQGLRLPNNSLRVLAACGTAAAIAASFNTPLAGVAFALEVLMFNYTVAAFAPVLLAAVSATALSQAVFGADLAFFVPDLALGSLHELPLVLLLGVVIGALSALFIRSLQLNFSLAQRLPLWSRGLAAGLLVGVIGLFVPEVMGIGYDTVNRLIQGELLLGLMLLIIALKLLASTVAVGMGIPGGLIGPALVVGAATGGVCAYLAHHMGWVEAGSSGFYVLLGMGAMMAATLQAPLAGLIAILELTGNPNIIFPGMLVVITATLTSGQLQGNESMYLAVLRAMGRDYRNDPRAQQLRRVGVGAVMERSFARLSRLITRKELEEALQQTPHWLLMIEQGEEPVLLSGADIAHALHEQAELGAAPETQIDLMDLPAHRLQATPLDIQASVQEARELLLQGAEAIYVTRTTVPGIPRIYGVLTGEEIESGYRL